MSESATETTSTTDAQSGTEPTAGQQVAKDPKDAPPWEREGVEFDADRAWKLLKNKDKDLAAAKQRVIEFEQSQMTEQQKLAARAEAAEKALADREQELLRHRIAAEKGIPAELLAGASEEEMAAHADRLLAFRGAQAPAGPPAYDGGQRTTAPVGDDMNSLIRRQLGRR